ncbi:MAG TPA: hypothetical protein OIM63_00380 [Bacilli bacterium]|nr:hypothetical protein [Bacilli bacterium]
MKKKIIIILVCVLILGIGLFFFLKKDNNTKEKNIENSSLTIENETIQVKDDKIILTANLKNNTKEEKYVNQILINIYLNDDQTVTSTKYINKVIKASEKESLVTILNNDNYNIDNIKVKYEIN